MCIRDRGRALGGQGHLLHLLQRAARDQLDAVHCPPGGDGKTAGYGHGSVMTSIGYGANGAKSMVPAASIRFRSVGTPGTSRILVPVPRLNSPSSGGSVAPPSRNPVSYTHLT